jgi:Gluconate 2-dehydrogenase subunit 3
MNRRAILKSSALWVSYAVSSNFITGCTEDEKQIPLSWQPIFLTNNQAQTVSAITECLLPRTKTPGAKDLNIDRFVDKMLKETLSPDEQKDFISSLNAFETACKSQYSRSFTVCLPQEQAAFVLQIDKIPVKYPREKWGIRFGKLPPTLFFRRVKELTLLGFFTAQEIGEKVLSFDPIPSTYVACIPLSQIRNAWNE